MLKRLQDLFKTPLLQSEPVSRPLMISRQCEGEGQDTLLLRELATVSLRTKQQPLHSKAA